MDITKILLEATPEAKKRFKALAKTNWDDDNYAILEYLLDGSSTPWQASVKRFQSGLSKLSQSALFTRARSVNDEIQFHFGKSIDEWITELKRDGEVRGIPNGLLASLKKRLTAEELSYTIVTVVTLEGK